MMRVDFFWDRGPLARMLGKKTFWKKSVFVLAYGKRARAPAVPFKSRYLNGR